MLADINVTPLVDVMLVLLIIFMIAAPMLHQGIEVALPKADAKNLPLRVRGPDRALDQPRRPGLPARDARSRSTSWSSGSRPQLAARGDDTVFLKGDRDVPYGRVIEVLDILHRAGSYTWAW